MIPRIPAFYEVVIGAIKAGVVAMPGTNLLQGKDIAYRIRRAEASMAIVTAAHAEKVEAIRDQCTTLEQVVVIGDRRPGWVPYETALEGFPDTLAPAQRVETRSDEPMLIHFTSGTTWQATTDAGLMIAPLHENPERVSAHADVPSAVDDVFDRALARDPDDQIDPFGFQTTNQQVGGIHAETPSRPRPERSGVVQVCRDCLAILTRRICRVRSARAGNGRVDRI